MGKKHFEVGDEVSFYHWDFEERVEGIIRELCANNMVQVTFKHPVHGYQLLGLHTSAISVISSNV